jgi:hypothetical protein
MARLFFPVLLLSCALRFDANAQTITGAAVPLYPPLARVAKVQGIVVLQVNAEEGRISAVKILSGHRRLSDAAVANVRTLDACEASGNNIHGEIPLPA